MARSNPQSLKSSVLALNSTPSTNRDSHADISPAVSPAPCVGKTVSVIGAARGTGQATVISFAAAGADRIAILDRVDATATRGRALQAAVGAGDLSPFELQPEPLGASDMGAWWRTWEVNVNGVYLVVRALLPLLFRGTEKTIVNVTSVGSLALTPGASAHQLSKLAVMRLSECLMLDYAYNGLLANSMHPALDLAKGIPEAVSKAAGCVDQPELAGDAVVYLTNGRREWLAGRHVSCAWYMRELMARKDEIVQNDLLKLNMSFGEAPTSNEMHVPYQRIRGRVPRNSY
ncbi:hypothetical protein MMC22_009388 [Lobaria immixta]|nr:hypothetical protein [Lobaria immixta]